MARKTGKYQGCNCTVKTSFPFTDDYDSAQESLARAYAMLEEEQKTLERFHRINVNKFYGEDDSNAKV